MTFDLDLLKSNQLFSQAILESLYIYQIYGHAIDNIDQPKYNVLWQISTKLLGYHTNKQTDRGGKSTSHTLLWEDELNWNECRAAWWPAKILYPAIHCCEQMSWGVMTGWLYGDQLNIVPSHTLREQMSWAVMTGLVYGDQLKYCTQPYIAVSRWAVLSCLDGCMVTS